MLNQQTIYRKIVEEWDKNDLLTDLRNHQLAYVPDDALDNYINISFKLLLHKIKRPFILDAEINVTVDKIVRYGCEFLKRNPDMTGEELLVLLALKAE
jgi:hypothetical protein